ncbi:MAG: hypothetical protein IKL63_03845 [Alistipes sp.]|nr:hypothetical protein [Alistipes sp.]
MAPYSIIIECNYEEFWRYNLAVSGVVMQSGGRVEFVKHLDEVAAVCSNLEECPKTYNRPKLLQLTTCSGDAITLYIYVIPHTLPLSRTVEECRPFDMRVTIKHGDNTIYNRHHEINQWSGDNIEIKFEGI